METVKIEVDRCLTMLRNKIRQQGFTQLKVQATLGWGRSYISQLLTKQKALRIEQILLILSVIGIEPAEFFDELYTITPHDSLYRRGRATISSGEALEPFHPELRDLRAFLHGLANLLLEKRLIVSEELSAAVEAAGKGLGSDPS